MKSSGRLWHRRLSYAALIPWAWLILTGSALIVGNFWREINRPFFVGETAAPLAEQLEQALRLGETRLRRLDFAHDGFSFRVVTESDGSYFFDSRGEEIAHFAQDETSWLEFITRLHRGRFLGLPGQVAFSISALFLCIFIASGLVIWRPSKALRLRGWHRFLGLFSALPLLILFFSGGLWNLSAQLRTPIAIDTAKVLRAEDWRAALAKSSNFSSSPKSIYKFPNYLLVELHDGSRIYLSQPEPLIFRSWTWSGWIEPFYNIHSGRIWGWFGRSIVAFTTFLAFALLVTGSLLLWPRR